MVQVNKEGILLERTDATFENRGVLNPAVIQNEEGIHLFYRAIGENFHSTIGYCRLKNPTEVFERFDIPLLTPEHEYESVGVEDPRIVQIEGIYFLTYTAYDGVNALGALATSRDLVHFEKRGIIVPYLHYGRFHECLLKNEATEKYALYNQDPHRLSNDEAFVWDKDLVFFPRKINNKLYFLHRIKPDMQLTSFDDLTDLNESFWENYIAHLHKHVVIDCRYSFEKSHIGGGCPPIETSEGWLIIYHGARENGSGFVYTACAALLDLNNPLLEIARLPYPLFKPEHQWEKEGIVNDVCFPTGALLFEDTLYIYYGAADHKIACASLQLTDLLEELISNKIKV